MSLPVSPQSSLERAVAQLTAALGANLHSLILYGSAARGELDNTTSDINVLLVLAQSTPESHLALRNVWREHPRLELLIVGLADLERTRTVFAAKFLSLRRFYRVLAGADVLANFAVDDDTHRFLTEQGLRNLQLRLTHAFVELSGEEQRYTLFLRRLTTSLLVNISDALRLSGTTLPAAFPARIPLLVQRLGPDAAALGELLALRHAPRRLDATEIEALHRRLLAVVNAALELLR
jgi:predicted nucleotidyltransferase